MIYALIDEQLVAVCLFVTVGAPPGLLPLSLDSRGSWVRIARWAPPGTPVEELEIVPQPKEHQC